MAVDSFYAKDTLEVGEDSFEIYRLDKVTGEGLDVDTLPFSLKVLLEGLLRTEDGENITKDDIEALAGWDADADPSVEIQFTPARVIMQDFTGVPCVVDLATMREAMADLGGDATRINPLAPAEMVIDHSVIADVFGTPEAFERNVEIEYERNRERYQFLRWGQGAFDDFKVVPPGTGIVHQVNIEHLARVVFTRDDDGELRNGRVPRLLCRHRLAHDDGQRTRRRGLGRRRHRGRGRHARPADQHADPAGGRVQAQRRAARGRHRHRPRAHDHRDAARARRRGQVRRVLRRRRRRRAARQPRHDRQHEPRVRLHHRGLPDRRGDHQVHEVHRPQRPADRAGRGLRQGPGHVARPRQGAPLLREARARPRRSRPLDRRSQAPAGPRLDHRREAVLPLRPGRLRRHGQEGGRTATTKRSRSRSLRPTHPAAATTGRTAASRC